MLFGAAHAGTPTIDAKIFTQKGELVLRLQAAATPKDRTKGLMNRDKLAPADGMIFLFPHASRHSFWMKDTRIPLDILFVDAQGSITFIAANTTPQSLNPIKPPSVVTVAIELDAGRASRDSIAVGDKIRYVLPSGIAIE